MMLAFGVGFEFPVLLVFLQLVGVLTPQQLSALARHAIVIVVVVAAVDHAERRPVQPARPVDPADHLLRGVDPHRVAHAPTTARGDARLRASVTAGRAHWSGWAPAPAARFLAGYDFALDDFQLRAHRRARRRLVGARRRTDGLGQDASSPSTPSPGRSPQAGEAFYTAPIKALSNQKYPDLVRRTALEQRRPAHRRQRHQRRRTGRGDDDRGAAQHDLRRAPARCATSATCRARRGPLPAGRLPRSGVGGGDHPPRRRRSRWSACRPPCRNAEELADWMTTVRGPTAAIIEERRPVELENLYLVGDRTAEQLHLLPTLVDGRPEPGGEPARRRGGPRAAVAPDASAAAGGSSRRVGSRSSSGSTTRACCRRSTSSSAERRATTPPRPASTPACG